MNKIKRLKILDYVYDKYTGQEVLECLSIECPKSYKYFYDKNIKSVKK